MLKDRKYRVKYLIDKIYGIEPFRRGEKLDGNRAN